MRDSTQEDIGSHVIFVDPVGAKHDALITAVHGRQCINLVYVVKDPNATDNYGRKTNKQYTSIMRGDIQQAHGNYWYFPEDANEPMKHYDIAAQ